MKNDTNQHIKQARQSSVYRGRATDILVIPEVVARNQAATNPRPHRKRRINYAKKILNDPFIFSI